MTTPTVASVRTAIKNKVAAVSNIGTVNDYERYSKNASELIAQYTATISGSRQLRGWNIRLTKTKKAAPASAGPVVVTHTWGIRGYMALDDSAASEKTFDNLVEAVSDAFDEDETIGGAVDSVVVDDIAGIQVDENIPVLFAGVLCHSAKLRLVTRHYK